METIEATKLKSDLSFSDHDLNAAMMRQASLYAHYAVIYSQAQKAFDTVKLAADIVESQVDKRLRDEAATSGQKITEAALSKEVIRDPKYIEAQKRVNDARMALALAREALEAFKQRRDMLVQIGVAQREEAKGELFLRGREENGVTALRNRANSLVQTV